MIDATKRAFILLGMIGALSAAPVLAQPQVAPAALQEAKQAFQQGQVAYDRGDYAGAIAEWQRSFELSQKVSLFYNIGLAYERMGKLAEAAGALERFVAGVAPDDPYLDRGRARLASIRERVAQTGVVIACNEEGATILVDDRDVGRTPRPDRVALAPGNHRIIVRKAGFADFRSDVALSAGQELKLDATLTPLAGAMAPDGSAPDGVDRATEEAPSEGPGVLGPALTIGGGVVVAAGVIVGAVALGKAKDAASEDDADSARTLALVADVSMAVGVLTAAVGTYLWLVVDADQESAPPTVAITPRRDGAMTTVAVRF